MKRIFLVAILVGISSVAVAGEAEYKYMLDTAAKIERDRATSLTAYHVAQQEKNEQLPEAIKACATLKNEVAQMVCTLAATGNLGSGGQMVANTNLPAISLPAPPVTVPWYDKLWDRGMQVLDRAVPIWGVRENRRATVDVARINAGVQIAGYEATTSQFNIMGQSNTAIAVAALNKPIMPTNQYTFGDVPGNVNFGGSQEVNSNSKNTTTKNCPGGQAGNGSSTTTVPGTGGSSPGGNC